MITLVTKQIEWRYLNPIYNDFVLIILKCLNLNFYIFIILHNKLPNGKLFITQQGLNPKIIMLLAKQSQECDVKGPPGNLSFIL